MSGAFAGLSVTMTPVSFIALTTHLFLTCVPVKCSIGAVRGLLSPGWSYGWSGHAVSTGSATPSPEAGCVSVRCRTDSEFPLVEATSRSAGPVEQCGARPGRLPACDSSAAGGWAARACSSIVGPVRGDAGATGGAGVGLAAAEGGNFGQAAGVGRRAPDAPGGDDGPAVAGSRRGGSHQQPPPGASRGPSGTGSRWGRRRGPRRAEKRDRQPLP